MYLSIYLAAFSTVTTTILLLGNTCVFVLFDCPVYKTLTLIIEIRHFIVL